MAYSAYYIQQLALLALIGMVKFVKEAQPVVMVTIVLIMSVLCYLNNVHPPQNGMGQNAQVLIIFVQKVLTLKVANASHLNHAKMVLFGIRTI